MCVYLNLKHNNVKDSFFVCFTFYFQANPPLVRPHKPMKSNKNDLEISVLGLHFVVSSQHFANGKLKVIFYYFIHTYKENVKGPFQGLN